MAFEHPVTYLGLQDIEDEIYRVSSSKLRFFKYILLMRKRFLLIESTNHKVEALLKLSNEVSEAVCKAKENYDSFNSLDDSIYKTIGGSNVFLIEMVLKGAYVKPEWINLFIQGDYDSLKEQMISFKDRLNGVEELLRKSK
jgi:hypothetical protein